MSSSFRWSGRSGDLRSPLILKWRRPYPFPVKARLDCDGMDSEARGNQLGRFTADLGVRYPGVSSVFLIHRWQHSVETLTKRLHRDEQPSGEFVGLAFKFVFTPVVFIQPVEQMIRGLNVC